jgi:hypothetical protein
MIFTAAWNRLCCRESICCAMDHPETTSRLELHQRPGVAGRQLAPSSGHADGSTPEPAFASGRIFMAIRFYRVTSQPSPPSVGALDLAPRFPTEAIRARGGISCRFPPPVSRRGPAERNRLQRHAPCSSSYRRSFTSATQPRRQHHGIEEGTGRGPPLPGA